MFDNIPKPAPYIPLIPPKAEYLKETQGNKSTERGKQFVSNRYNFLLEVMKLLPRAEAEIYKEGVEYKKSANGTGISSLENITNIDEQYKYEFGPGGFGNGKGGGFGYVHTQSETDDDDYSFLGAGGGKQFKNFDFTDAFYEFSHTNDGVERANFFISKEEYEKKDDGKSVSINGNSVYDEGLVGSTPIPVYSTAAADGSNRYKGANTDLANFFPTDYNNLMFGMNPSMLKEDPNTHLKELPNIAAYDTGLFQGAQDYFRNNIYTFSNYTESDGGRIERNKNKTPSFYQIMMDPTAPWNNGDAAQDGTWWKDKENSFGEIAFNMATLLLESKRRYFAAMTQLIGPHSQFNDFTEAKSKGLDAVMIANQDRFLGKQFGGSGVTEGSWMAKETGVTDKIMFRNFMASQHRITQIVDMFSEGIGIKSGAWKVDAAGNLVLDNKGNKIHEGWESDYSQAIKFRDWMLKNLSNYKSTYIAGNKLNPFPNATNIVPAINQDFTFAKLVAAKAIVNTPEGSERADALKAFTNLYNGFMFYMRANPQKDDGKVSSYKYKQLVDEHSAINKDVPNYVNYTYFENMDTSNDTAFKEVLTKTDKVHKYYLEMNEEITKLNAGFSYDQMVYELYYHKGEGTDEVSHNDAAGNKVIDTAKIDAKAVRSYKNSTGIGGIPTLDNHTYIGNYPPEAFYNKQPIATIANAEKGTLMGERAWEKTAGNFVSNIGIKGGNPEKPDVFAYSSKEYNTKNSRGAIIGQHHWYSPSQQLANMSPFFFKGKETKMNANNPDQMDSNLLNYVNFKDFAVDKIWMTHFYGILTEQSALAELTGGFIASMYNKISKTQYENKEKQYKEKKDEEYFSKIEEAKGQAKAMAKKKSQDVQLKQVVEKNIQKNKAQRKSSEVKQKPKGR